MPLRDPKRLARGKILRTQLPKGESKVLITPVITKTESPTCQAKFCAASGSPGNCLWPRVNAGKRTKKATPKVLGVSNPKGIAVTALPTLLAKRNPMAEKTKSPKRTPSAVPGTMLETTKSGEKTYLPDSTCSCWLWVPEIRPSKRMMTATLSKASPKNAFRSDFTQREGRMRRVSEKNIPKGRAKCQFFAQQL